MSNADSVVRKFLDTCVGKTVKIFTRNGFQLAGRLDAWDNQAMLISICGVDNLVMMANVSTVIPLED